MLDWDNVPWEHKINTYQNWIETNDRIPDSNSQDHLESILAKWSANLHSGFDDTSVNSLQVAVQVPWAPGVRVAIASEVKHK